MIQGSINQLLNIAALSARLDPNLESRTEARKASRQIAIAEAQLAQIKPTEASQEGTVAANIAQEVLEDRAQASEALFRAKPTEETYRQYSRNRAETGREPVARIQATPEEIAQERAEQEAEAAQRIRQQELARVREALTANAPTTYGRRDRI